MNTPYPSGASTLRILMAALAPTLVAPNASAQSIVTGAISGTVLDESGRPVPDAHVILTETGTGRHGDQDTQSLASSDHFDVGSLSKTMGALLRSPSWVQSGYPMLP